MRPTLQQAQQNVLRFWPALLPFLLIFTSTLSTVTTLARHSLFVNAISWLAVALYYAFKVGVQCGKGSPYKRRLSWSSGFLYALAQICERASNERDALWWAQVRYAQMKQLYRCLTIISLSSQSQFTSFSELLQTIVTRATLLQTTHPPSRGFELRGRSDFSLSQLA